MQRTASAVWTGGLKDGSGTISAQSGALSKASYSAGTRFEKVEGTSPEELIAAAHAACFSMAFAGELGKAGMKPESIRTTATVAVEKGDAGFAITTAHLDVTARVPGANRAAFETAANAAKEGCPVSKVLKARITMNAKLES